MIELEAPHIARVTSYNDETIEFKLVDVQGQAAVAITIIGPRDGKQGEATILLSDLHKVKEAMWNSFHHFL